MAASNQWLKDEMTLTGLTHLYEKHVINCDKCHVGLGEPCELAVMYRKSVANAQLLVDMWKVVDDDGQEG